MQLQRQSRSMQTSRHQRPTAMRCAAAPRNAACRGLGSSTAAASTTPVLAAGAAARLLPSSKRCLVVPGSSAEPNVAVQQPLLDYISAGPLLGVAGISPQQVQQQLPEWERLGRQLASQLGFEHDAMDDVQKLRVYRYYLPVFFWVQQQLQQHKAKFGGQPAPPLVLGISAPQGCGKSTLVEQLEALCNAGGQPAASVSIDDFYLTRAQQEALAAAHPDNRLLALRGNAGSHDLQLGADTLSALRGLSAKGSSTAVPRYDKSAFQGLGDRAPQSAWPVVAGPLEVVFFEGWMSGFRPMGQAAAAAVEPALAEVDARLAGYEGAWDAAVDAWLVIRIGDPQWVFGWRLQAEQRMRAAGKPGMSDEQIADFVSRYMPAYTAYLPGLYASGPTTAKAGATLVIEVDQGRSPVQQQPAPLALPS